MEYPLRHSMSESEVVPRKHEVAENDSQGGKDKQAQYAEDVFPNYGTFLDGERVSNLR